MPPEIRDVVTLDHCREVVALQREVWGQDGETVPASVLVVSIKRGGILLGAFDDTRLAGFLFSMAGFKDGRRTQWSHMLAVKPEARGRGLGEQLKRAQRDRALSQGVELIEWTMDPLQTTNAALNLSRLGATARTYLIDVYGASASPLHRGTPTDRLLIEWRLNGPAPGPGGRAGTAPDAGNLPRLIDVRQEGHWAVCGAWQPATGPAVLVPIPQGFTEMQQQAPDLALTWRLTAREVLMDAFQRGYVATAFRDGCYVLESAI